MIDNRTYAKLLEARRQLRRVENAGIGHLIDNYQIKVKHLEDKCGINQGSK